MNEDINFLQVLVHALIALCAGIMKELNQINKHIEIHIGTFIIDAAVSSFTGVTTFFLLQSFHADQYLIAFATSIAGWMGGSFLDFFGALVKKLILAKTGIDELSNQESENEEHE